MKLSINQTDEIQETEIIINCPAMDVRIRALADYIRQYSASLEGKIDGAVYSVPLDTILYIDSADKKTYLYDRGNTYDSPCTLAELEEKLAAEAFVRISKNCIVNMAYIVSTLPRENRRLELSIAGGERLMVARNYRNAFQARFRAFRADAFHVPAFLSARPYGQMPECSVYNAGRIMSFSSRPSRVVALSYGAAELLAALGQADRIIAVAPAESSPEEVTPAYRARLQTVPLITNHGCGVPAVEQLKELDGDFTLGSYYFLHALEKQGARPADAGINLYAFVSTMPESATMEALYKDILNLGKIFRAESAAVKLVEQTRKQVATLRRSALGRAPVRVFVYDGGEETPRTAMAGTLENHLITLAGGRNVFNTRAKAYAAVTWAQAAENDPEVIVLHDYEDRMSAEEKIAVLKSRPEMQNVSAVRNNRFVTLSLSEIFPGVQNAKAIEKCIRVFHRGLL